MLSRGPRDLSTTSARASGSGVSRSARSRRFSSSEWERRFAGHRLTAALPRGIYVGMGETVVYTGRSGLQVSDAPRLILRAAVQRGNQCGQHSLDARLEGAASARPACSTGSFSSTIFSTSATRTPARTGSASPSRRTRFSWSRGESSRLPGDTRASTRTRTAIHGDRSTSPADGDTEMNPLLGSSMGPDADRGFIKGTLGVSGRDRARARGGEHEIRRAEHAVPRGAADWVPGMDSDPPFPSPPVLYVKYVTGEPSL